MNRSDSFLHESKSKQVIRILNTIHHAEPHERTTESSRNAYNKLLNDLKSIEYSHYIDLPILITSWFQLFLPSQTRNFDYQLDPSWTEYSIKDSLSMHPHTILFCSSLNDATDLELRNNLKIDLGEPSHIEPISYYVFDKIRCNVNNISNDIKKRSLALMFFQGTPDSLREIASAENYFNDILRHKWFTETYKWKVELAGLLVGEFEGFILFSAQNKGVDISSLENELKESLRLAVKNKKGSFQKFVPITLFFGQWEEQIFVREENINLIFELSNHTAK